MDTLKDIWASLVSGVRERTTNPLSFAFLLSWCIWNFKFFVVLLGDGTTAQRLSVVEAMYPSTSYMGGALLYPLLTAIAYVFLYPFVSARSIKFYREKQVEIANTVKGLEEERLLTSEEAVSLTRKHEADRRLWRESEAALNTEIDALRDALSSAEEKGALTAPASAPADPINETANPLSKTDYFKSESEIPEDVAGVLGALSQQAINILIGISGSSGGIFPSVWATESRRNFTLVEADLERLSELDLAKLRETGSLCDVPPDSSAATLRRAPLAHMCSLHLESHKREPPWGRLDSRLACRPS